MNYPNSTELTRILYKYVYPIQADNSLLKAFYSTNRIPDSSQFYETFRYPFRKDFQKDYDYKDLRRSGKEGMIFFKQIIEDIRFIMKEIKEL